ncbi:hypothetical protein EGW08_013874 [Elysia chlorotica]|uniref:Uncharacterized protein n=1 Tax=Elysia chlorotica TaxID=188477 RepID=A0A433TA75_ELYCH|nr:hypothetical protein EGW08_013874 [Elysia chlorotica]
MSVAGLGLILPLLLSPQEVTSFSVGGRTRRRANDARNLDLAQALALLQRERRRADDGEYLTAQDLLGSRPLGKDVNDWISSARDLMLDDDDLGQYLGVDEEPTWVSDDSFKEFDPQTQTVKPTQKEIESIFSNDDKPEESNEKKKKDIKKKRSSPKVERKIVKKSVPPRPVSVDDESSLSLDTLTQEEFKALMKAVGKLQRQVAAKGNDEESQGEDGFLQDIGEPEPQQEMAIVQPASKEELQSLFAKEDDDIGDQEQDVDKENPDVDIVPKSEVIVEEEVKTPVGERRVLEVNTPQGGARLTELEAPDGQQEIVEETLPEGSMGSMEAAIEDSEREISDALASQLERDISQEAINEELEAEEEEAEEKAEEEAAAADEAVSAAEEEIAREIGANDLAALEQMWMSKSGDIPPYAEKRTTKRAARNGLSDNYRPNGIPDDLTLERLLTNSDVEGEDGNSHLPREVAGLPPPIGKFVTRIVELQDEVGQLRAIAQLADLENDVLTDALNEATMAQAPGTVSDMEFESLQQAIWVEKELQRSKVQNSDSVLLNLSVKKKYSYTKSEIERLLDETYLNKGTLPDLEDSDEADSGVASIFLQNADQCPAVRKYSTNCELADLYSLPVDYEARALCNLHEMCYACGHSLHVPQASCDEVYRAAAKTLCREGSACVLEAEIFLRTMKLKTRYVPHSQPTCRSTCMARFLGML